MKSKIVSMNEIRELTGFSRPIWDFSDINITIPQGMTETPLQSKKKTRGRTIRYDIDYERIRGYK